MVAREVWKYGSDIDIERPAHSQLKNYFQAVESS